MTPEQNKKIVADAIKEISKEEQEKQIEKIKGIVKCYLEKIQGKKEKEDEIRKERLALEKDLDDLKAGRLDKIEERQGKDPIHDRVTIIQIHKIEPSFIPYRPWQSPWFVEVKPIYQPQMTWSYTSATSQLPSGGTQAYQMQTTGIQMQNFVGGSYQVGNQNINL